MRRDGDGLREREREGDRERRRERERERRREREREKLFCPPSLVTQWNLSGVDESLECP